MSQRTRIASRTRAPDRSYNRLVGLTKSARFLIQGLIYCTQLIRCEIAVFSIPDIAAEISEMKSSVNCGTNSANDSLKRLMNDNESPGTKPTIQQSQNQSKGKKM
jgi:hypothetical protein